MCAIFGSFDLSKFRELYDLNRKRGAFAFGGTFISMDKVVRVVKCPKIYDFNDDYSTVLYFTGHTQAPTSAAQHYSIETSHPFMCGDWIVAHNGVLTNYDSLSKEVDPTKINLVDSSVIPALLDKESNDKTLVDIIKSVLSRLEGTHTTTIVNKKHRKVFVARCGSTLFIDDRANYSSTPFQGSVEVPDGSILELISGKLESVGKFEPKSPFFIL